MSKSKSKSLLNRIVKAYEAKNDKPEIGEVHQIGVPDQMGEYPAIASITCDDGSIYRIQVSRYA